MNTKKQRFEFPIAPEYADYWTIPDAIRELYANALDRCGMCPEKVAFHYDELQGKLRIGNKVDTKMTTRALVLGASDKNPDEIGRFGEGMKMAYLTLLRMGREVLTENVDELWKPKFDHSEVYEGQVLVLDVEECPYPSEHSVTHTLEVTRDELVDFMQTCLTFAKYAHGAEPRRFAVEEGEILLGSISAGRVYVGGMLVAGFCEGEQAGIGINIGPLYAKLGRDRKSIDDEDESLVWAMLARATKQHAEVKSVVLEDENLSLEMLRRALEAKKAVEAGKTPSKRAEIFMEQEETLRGATADAFLTRVKDHEELHETTPTHFSCSGTGRSALPEEMKRKVLYLPAKNLVPFAENFGLKPLQDMLPEAGMRAQEAMNFLLTEVPEDEREARLRIFSRMVVNYALF